MSENVTCNTLSGRTDTVGLPKPFRVFRYLILPSSANSLTTGLAGQGIPQSNIYASGGSFYAGFVHLYIQPVISAGTYGELAKTCGELAETCGELAETCGELAETCDELAETCGEN
jgi:hypothetical protein